MRKNNLFSQRGFTLVEVLTVMLVLVALASITVESTKDFVFQGRYDVTKDRYEKIKKAIIGDPNQVINGQPNIEGYVKDKGNLPPTLQTLVDDGYLSSAEAIKDGWGNAFQATSSATAINLYSWGKDGQDGGSDYDRDYPNTGGTDAIKSSDWQVNLNQIQVAIHTPYSGTCNGSTCSNPAYTTQTNCEGAGAGTWIATPFTSSKTNCEAGGKTWTYTPATVCIKIIANRESATSYPSADTVINEDANTHFLSVPSSVVAMGGFIGIVLKGSCTGAVTTDSYVPISPLPNSLCVNKNNAASFTKAHCEANSGKWISDGSEEYCDGVISTACTDATGTYLGGVAYPKFQINLVPHTTLPTINW